MSYKLLLIEHKDQVEIRYQNPDQFGTWTSEYFEKYMSVQDMILAITVKLQIKSL